MISGTCRYALRILGYLAERQGQLIQASQIAEQTGIPANYLGKILNRLRKQGIVASQRGWGGGFTLREEGLDRALAEVVEVFDGRRSEDECFLGLAHCDDLNPCPLHHWWEGARDSYEEMLRKMRVRDLRSAAGELRS